MAIMPCKSDGCDRTATTRGLCHACYENLRSKGLLEAKKCRGCDGPCPGRKHYCSDDCKPRCSVQGCGDQAICRGWCTFHYTRWKLAGDPTAEFSRQQYSDGQLCSFKGCGGKARKAGLCSSHYGQRRKGQELRPLEKKHKKIGLTSCCIHACPHPVKEFYLCNTHIMRLRRTGTTNLIERPPNRCRFPKCESPASGDRWCVKHYKRIKKTGSPFDKDQPFVKDDWTECVICHDEIPESRGASRYCSAGCIWIAGHGDRPRSSPCAQCGTAIDYWKRDHRGRLVKASRKLCGNCDRPASLSRFVPHLAERDGVECGICGKDIDLDITWPDPMSRSVDHVIPYSLGGENDVSNYQLTHLRCNMLKSNRVAEAV